METQHAESETNEIKDDNSKTEKDSTKGEREFAEHLQGFKLVLDNGTTGLVVEQRCRNSRGQMVYVCYPCGVTLYGENRAQDHVHGKKHLLKLSSKKKWPESIYTNHPYENVPRLEDDTSLLPAQPKLDKFQFDLSVVCKIQTHLDSFRSISIIGLEYLVEILPDVADDDVILYSCALCTKNATFPLDKMLQYHLVSSQHVLRYMSLHFKTVYIAIKAKKIDWKQQVLHDTTARLSQAVENCYGRLRPVQCTSLQWNTLRREIFRTISKREHFTEKLGKTFLEIVRVPDQHITDDIKPETTNTDAKTITFKTVGNREHFSNKLIKNFVPIVAVKPVQDIGKDPIPRSANCHFNNAIEEQEKKDVSLPSATLLSATPLSAPVVQSDQNKEVNVEDSVRSHNQYGQGSPIRDDKRTNSTISPEDRKKLFDKVKLYCERTQEQLDTALKQMAVYEKNPEKHPQYPDEWVLFWNRRFMEIRAENKDTSTHDFKSEWIIYWPERLVQLHNDKIESNKKTLRKELGFPVNKSPTRDLFSQLPSKHDSSSPCSHTSPSPQARLRLPVRRSRSPRRRSRSPRRHSRSPRRRSRSLRRRSRSPRKRSRSPSKRSHSPRKRFCSPRKCSQSPRRRSSLLRRRSRSPITRRRPLSPLPRRSPRKLNRSTESDHRQTLRTRSQFPRSSISPAKSHEVSNVLDVDDAGSLITKFDVQPLKSQGASFTSKLEAGLERHSKELRKSRYNKRSSSSRSSSDYYAYNDKVRHKCEAKHFSQTIDNLKCKGKNNEDNLECEDSSSCSSISTISTISSICSAPSTNTGQTGARDIVPVLRLLAALEDYLGPSLGPGLLKMLGEALKMEKQKPNLSWKILESDTNLTLLEMCKEKLRGKMEAGLLENAVLSASLEAIVRTTALLQRADSWNSQMMKENEENIKKQVNSLDKSTLLQQIGEALVRRGKIDVTNEELATLVDSVVAEKSKCDQNTQLSNDSGSRTTDNMVLKMLQTAYEAENKEKQRKMTSPIHETDPMDGLSDSELRTLMRNFKHLSQDEQERLVSYINMLEVRNPQRMERLRRIMRFGIVQKNVTDTNMSIPIQDSVTHTCEIKAVEQASNAALKLKVDLEPNQIEDNHKCQFEQPTGEPDLPQEELKEPKKDVEVLKNTDSLPSAQDKIEKPKDLEMRQQKNRETKNLLTEIEFEERNKTLLQLTQNDCSISKLAKLSQKQPNYVFLPQRSRADELDNEILIEQRKEYSENKEADNISLCIQQNVSENTSMDVLENSVITEDKDSPNAINITLPQEKEQKPEGKYVPQNKEEKPANTPSQEKEQSPENPQLSRENEWKPEKICLYEQKTFEPADASSRRVKGQKPENSHLGQGIEKKIVNTLLSQNQEEQSVSTHLLKKKDEKTVSTSLPRIEEGKPVVSQKKERKPENTRFSRRKRRKPVSKPLPRKKESPVSPPFPQKKKEQTMRTHCLEKKEERPVSTSLPQTKQRNIEILQKNKKKPENSHLGQSKEGKPVSEPLLQKKESLVSLNLPQTQFLGTFEAKYERPVKTSLPETKEGKPEISQKKEEKPENTHLSQRKEGRPERELLLQKKESPVSSSLSQKKKSSPLRQKQYLKTHLLETKKERLLSTSIPQMKKEKAEKKEDLSQRKEGKPLSKPSPQKKESRVNPPLPQKQKKQMVRTHLFGKEQERPQPQTKKGNPVMTQMKKGKHENTHLTQRKEGKLVSEPLPQKKDSPVSTLLSQKKVSPVDQRLPQKQKEKTVKKKLVEKEERPVSASLPQKKDGNPVIPENGEEMLKTKQIENIHLHQEEEKRAKNMSQLENQDLKNNKLTHLEMASPMTILSSEKGQNSTNTHLPCHKNNVLPQKKIKMTETPVLGLENNVEPENTLMEKNQNIREEQLAKKKEEVKNETLSEHSKSEQKKKLLPQIDTQKIEKSKIEKTDEQQFKESLNTLMLFQQSQETQNTVLLPEENKHKPIKMEFENDQIKHKETLPEKIKQGPATEIPEKKKMEFENDQIKQKETLPEKMKQGPEIEMPEKKQMEFENDQIKQKETLPEKMKQGPEIEMPDKKKMDFENDQIKQKETLPEKMKQGPEIEMPDKKKMEFENDQIKQKETLPEKMKQGPEIEMPEKKQMEFENDQIKQKETLPEKMKQGPEIEMPDKKKMDFENDQIKQKETLPEKIKQGPEIEMPEKKQMEFENDQIKQKETLPEKMKQGPEIEMPDKKKMDFENDQIKQKETLPEKIKQGPKIPLYVTKMSDPANVRKKSDCVQKKIGNSSSQAIKRSEKQTEVYPTTGNKVLLQQNPKAIAVSEKPDGPSSAKKAKRIPQKNSPVWHSIHAARNASKQKSTPNIPVWDYQPKQIWYQTEVNHFQHPTSEHQMSSRQRDPRLEISDGITFSHQQHFIPRESFPDQINDYYRDQFSDDLPDRNFHQRQFEDYTQEYSHEENFHQECFREPDMHNYFHGGNGNQYYEDPPFPSIEYSNFRGPMGGFQGDVQGWNGSCGYNP